MKKILLCTAILMTVVSCDRGEVKEKEEYATLPPDVKEQVLTLDAEIKKLQKEMEYNLRQFQKEEVEAQGEVFDDWQEFSESVKAGEKFQDKANAIREKIVQLQQQKVRLLENGFPEK